MSYVWFGAMVLFVIIEAATMGINFVWFALGSLGAMIASMLGGQIWIQVVVFIAITALTLYFTRPLVKKYFNSKRVRTNADRIIGKTATVIENIDNNQGIGQINVEGQIWSAKSESGEVIEKGSYVTIISIVGVKAVVK